MHRPRLPSNPANYDAMNFPSLLPLAASALFLTTSCDKSAPDLTGQLAELERKANEATERQQELEQELEEQRLAAERDAIERERMKTEEERIAIEQRQGEIAEADAEKIRLRDEELRFREAHLLQQQNTLEEQQQELDTRTETLSERETELAGTEALEFKEQQTQQAPAEDYGMFYESLTPYGSWFETADYGYVWQPGAVRDTSWRPYSRGRWACTDRGWTWISEEPFGWATYHYGRWAQLSGRGWVWVPGSQWAPSWVSWRYCDSYVGWAPLPPETLAYREHRWDSSVETRFGISANWYNFVSIRHFGGPIRRHCLPYARNSYYMGLSVNVTNIYIKNRSIICGGPRYRSICDRSPRAVPFYRLDMDHHGRPNRGSLGMRSHVRGNRLRVAAPRMDVARNPGIKPKRVRGRIDSATVVRSRKLSPEITARYRQSRQSISGKKRVAQHRSTSIKNKGRISQSKPQSSTPTRVRTDKTGPRIHPPGPTSQGRRNTRKQSTAKTPAESKTTDARIHPPKSDTRILRTTKESQRSQTTAKNKTNRFNTPHKSKTTSPRIVPSKPRIQRSREKSLTKTRPTQARPQQKSAKTQVTPPRIVRSQPKIQNSRTSSLTKSRSQVRQPQRKPKTNTASPRITPTQPRVQPRRQSTRSQPKPQQQRVAPQRQTHRSRPQSTRAQSSQRQSKSSRRQQSAPRRQSQTNRQAQHRQSNNRSSQTRRSAVPPR